MSLNEALLWIKEYQKCAQYTVLDLCSDF